MTDLAPFTAWLSLAGVCLLGAMSPGPSLAVVAAQSLRGGTEAGVAAALAHGLGVALYAAAVVSGLAALFASAPVLLQTVQYAGAAFLLYLGLRSLLSRGTNTLQSDYVDSKHLRRDERRGNDGDGGIGGNDKGLRGAWGAGFSVAFLNPKLALFFLALFSQFIGPEAGWGWKALMVATAGLIDALWYGLVSLLLGQARILERLRRHQWWIDRLFGLILIALAVQVAIR